MKKIVLSVAVIATMGLASCGGVNVCDCVNMDRDKLTEECKELEVKYDKASDEEKKEMKAEAKACKDAKEEAAPEEEAAH